MRDRDKKRERERQREREKEGGERCRINCTNYPLKSLMLIKDSLTKRLSPPILPHSISFLLCWSFLASATLFHINLLGFSRVFLLPRRLPSSLGLYTNSYSSVKTLLGVTSPLRPFQERSSSAQTDLITPSSEIFPCLEHPSLSACITHVCI